MCFVNDYDWICRQQEESSYPAEKPTRCKECRKTIPVGETVYHLHQQEYEDGDCAACYHGNCDCPDEECCQCPDPDYGETYEYDCCEDCWLFRQAVALAEQEAGCSAWESQPNLAELYEAIQNGGPDEAKKYWKTFLRNHPDRKTFAGRMWKKCFGG